MSTPSPAGAPEAPLTWRDKGIRVVLALVVLAIALFWLYAFFWPREARDRIDDRAWAERAEAICAEYREQIDALPEAFRFEDIEPREEALRQRADVGQQATDLLRQMVADLRTAPTPADADSAEVVGEWLADWDRYLAARDAHVAEWRSGVDRRFAEPPAEEGEQAPVSLRMDAFAGTNDMASCKVPQDLG